MAVRGRMQRPRRYERSDTDPLRIAWHGRYPLFFEEAQTELGIIGMMSVACKIYGAEETAMREAESALPEKKPSAWLSENAFEQFRAEAERAVKGDKTSAKNLQNYLV